MSCSRGKQAAHLPRLAAFGVYRKLARKRAAGSFKKGDAEVFGSREAPTSALHFWARKGSTASRETLVGGHGSS